MRANYRIGSAAIFLLMAATTLHGQTTEANLHSLLAQPVQPAGVSILQMEQFLSRRITPLPSPKSANEWTAQEEKLRKHVLDDVAFHGWPNEWVHSSLHFEEVGVIESGHG